MSANDAEQVPPAPPEPAGHAPGRAVPVSLHPDDAENPTELPLSRQSLEVAVPSRLAKEEQAPKRHIMLHLPVALLPLFENLGGDTECSTSAHRQRVAVRYGLEVLRAGNVNLKWALPSCW